MFSGGIERDQLHELGKWLLIQTPILKLIVNYASIDAWKMIDKYGEPFCENWILYVL